MTKSKKNARKPAVKIQDLQPKTAPKGGVNKVPGRLKYSNITLKRGT